MTMICMVIFHCTQEARVLAARLLNEYDTSVTACRLSRLSADPIPAISRATTGMVATDIG